jgi:chorismate mutase
MPGTFDEVASDKQKEQMEGLRKQIKSLSTNPLADINLRMNIAKKILELRLKAGANDIT